MKRKEIPAEIIYALILVIGLVLRIAKLGELPLSDYEARIALDAQRLISSSANAVQSDQVFLTNILGSLFYLFGTGNFIARLFPMVIGTLLVLLPAFFRKYFNEKALIILSFWIAISPTFVSLSRQVDSSILFLFSLSLFVLFILRRQPIGSSIFLVLAVLSGRIFFWNLLLAIVVFLYVNSFIRNNKITFKEFVAMAFEQAKLRTFLVSFLISYVLLSTFGFVFRHQFTGIARGLIGFIQVFKDSTNFWNLGLVTRSILYYEFAAILFGTIGLIWLIKKHRLSGLTILGFVTINIILIMISVEKNLVWNIFILAPLMISGSFFLSNFLTLPAKYREKTLSITAIGFSIVIFIGLAMASMFVNQNYSGEQANIRLLYILAGFVLILGAGFLAGWAISWKIAGRSFLLLATIIFSIFTISSMWNGAGLRLPFENDLLRVDKIPLEEDLLVDTIEDFSLWNYRDDTNIKILVINNELPSLQWSLRNFKDVVFQNSTPKDEVFDVIITGKDQVLEQTDSFRGQEILWYSEPDWQNMNLTEITKWFLTRRTTHDEKTQKSLIIWVRNSLVPGFQNNS